MKTKHLLLILLLAALCPWTAMAQKTHIASTSTSTTMTWAEFAQNVNNGMTYSGTTVYLDEDITATTMAGSDENICFMGTFEGNGNTITFNHTNNAGGSANWYHGLFRYLNGATIQNLKVDGTITTNAARCGGLAGHCYGKNTITNCVSDITINSLINSDGTYGGFVSIVRTDTTTFEGCAFTGRLLGSGTYKSGGLVGSTVTAVVFNNCVFAPTEVTIGLNGSATFSRKFYPDSSVISINNSYYTYDFNDGTTHVGQGKQRYTVTGQNPVSVAMNGTATNYNVSHITTYSDNPGLLYNGTIFAGSGEQVSLNLSGGDDDAYITDHGTLTGTTNPYTLTMWADNTVIMKAPEEFQVIGEQSAYTAYNIFPGYNGYCYKVFIYRPEDAEFLNYDFDISSIAFDVTQSRTSIAELALWVKDVDADYIMYGYQNFAYFIDGATQVYDTQTTFDLTTGWHTFAFNSTVPHEGGKALLVAMRGVSSNVAGNTTSSSNNVRITSKLRASWSLGANNTDPGYNSNTGAQSELRANIRLGIDYTGATCFSPTNLFVTYPDCVDTEVNLGWTENSEATTWEICLNGDENNLITANSNPFTLTGLTPNATYTAKVRAVCGDDLRSQWSESVSFEPTIKTVVGIYETGAPQLPTTINSIYSLSQQIYTPAELGDAGTIISIDFFNGESGEATRNLEIYMKHTDWEDFNTWNHVEPTDLVFSGTVSFASQAWTTITLDTPFAYDGEQNVVITVDDNTGSATSGFYHFLCFYTTDQSYQSIAYYGDENYDPTFTYSQGYTTRGKYKNQIRLVKVLKAPEMTVSYANGNTTLNWTDSSASGWQICIDGDENNLITVTENTYTMTNFTPSADHTFKVRAFCGTSNYGEWSQEASFRPSNFTVTDITTNGATLHWDSYTTTSAWQVSLVNKYSAYNLYTPEIIDVDSNPFTLTDLEGPMSYYVKVRNCYGPNDYSEWSDEVEFSTYMDFPYFTDFDSVYIKRSDYEYGLSQGITLEQLIELRKNCFECVPPFWYRHSDGGAVSWVRFKYDSNFANSGDGFMQFNVPKEMGQVGHTGYYYAFMSTVAPDMDISSLGVEFMAKKDSNSQSVSTFTVGVMEDDNTFVPIKTITPKRTWYLRYSVSLHPYTGNGKRIAFRTSYVDGKDNIAYIDDVLVKDCQAISEFPWSEDFEGYWADPSADLHWSYLHGHDNYNFINGCWENVVVSGTSLQFEVSRYNLYNNWTNKLNIAFEKAGTTKFMTPLMDLPDNNYEFMFDVFRDWESGYANDRIKVYASANGEITGATLLATINHHYSVGDGHHIPAESEAGWYHYALPIGMEGPCYIILVAESQSTDNTLRMFLDNFMVREIANCPEPADLTVSNLTINTVQLGWTADSGHAAWQVCVDGDEDHLIDVTGNSYTITGLSAASSHSAKVRALCSAGGYSYWSDEVFFTTNLPPVDLPYGTDFEDGCDWRFVNGDCDAQWTWGTAGYFYGASAGNHSVYISNDGGNTPGYNPDLPSLVFATKTFNFTGAPHYSISYLVDYRYYYATVQYYGWYYTRVALVPEALAATLTANVFPEGFSRTSLPEGWIALDGGEGIYRTSSKSMEIDIDDGTYVMVFAFRNTLESQGVRNPPAIDNISIEPVNCLKPTDLHLEALTTTTATLGWTENSEATTWEICLNGDENNLITANSNPFTLTGLTPNATYTAKVRSLHNGTQSFWSDYITFATDVACPAPTGLAAANVGPYTADLSWTSGADAWEVEVSYNIPAIVTTLTANAIPFTVPDLIPETEYSVRVRANCGDEGYSEWSSAITFTTLEACPVPDDLTVSDIAYNSATVAWTGFNDSYVVSYRTAAYEAAPFKQDFENELGNWTFTSMNAANDINADGTNHAGIYPVAAHSGSNGFRFSSYTQKTDGETYDQYLVSPELTVTGNLKFYFKKYNTSAETLYVGYSTTTNDLDAFTWSENLAPTTTWQEYTQELASDVKYIAFHYFGNYTYYVYVDDITIGAYDDVPAGEWETVQATESPVTLTGLTPETPYEVKVQGFCDGEPTEETAIVTFTTLEQTTVTQSILLSTGVNWFSTNVEITMDDLKAALEAAATGNITITSQRNGMTTYNGTRWRGTLSTLDVAQSYRITVAGDCEITLEGMPVDPADHPITINSGANWIGFPLQENMSIADVFAGFAVNGDVINSQREGMATYNGTRWRGTLGNGSLKPGQGYIYNSKASESRTLVFPSPSKARKPKP